MRQVVGWKEEENVMKTINQEKVEKEEGLETEKGEEEKEKQECNEDN